MKDSLRDRLRTRVVYKFSSVQVVILVTSVKQADIFLRAYTSTYHQVKLKESMYIKWEKPDQTQQVKH